MKIHIVQKGDTLWNLAKKYGVSFDELKKLNSQLSNPDMIMPGMKIKIPGTGTVKQTGKHGNIQIGSKKEMPIQGVHPHKVKEHPVQMPVQGPGPVHVHVQPPIPVQPKVQKVKEVPIYQQMPIAPAVQQPVIPEVDVHNYYMVNMSNMNVQKPTSVQEVKPAPVVQPQPQPIKPAHVVKQPHYIQPIPVMQPQCMPFEEPCMPLTPGCVPITPIMPLHGYCPPFYPMHQHWAPLAHPYMEAQPMCEGSSYQVESSDSSSHHAMHYQQAPFMQAPVQQMHPGYGAPFMQGYVQGSQYVSPHGMHHHFESSSAHMGMESSSTSMFHGTQKGVHGFEHVQQPVTYEEDCGCGGEKPKLQAQFTQAPSHTSDPPVSMGHPHNQAMQQHTQAYAVPYGYHHYQQQMPYQQTAYPYQHTAQQSMAANQQPAQQGMMMHGQQAMQQREAYYPVYGQFQQMPAASQAGTNWAGQQQFLDSDVRSSGPVMEEHQPEDETASEHQEQAAPGTFDIPASAEEDNE